MDRYFEALAGLTPAASGRIAAVGVFDGVHRGHRSILEEALQWARAGAVPALTITFSSHPDRVVKNQEPRFIVSLGRRIEILESMGFDATLLLPFNERISRIPARAFILDFLVRGLGLTGLVVGQNFRFGHRAQGDADLLQQLGAEHGFGVRVLPPVFHGDQVISSSLIRNLVEDGAVETALELLGRPFHLRGQVVLGQRRGRTIGFPTVNLAPGTLLRPAVGVYATRVERSNGEVHRAVTNVGVCPTFGPGAPVTVESHILDFDQEIYGEEVGVAFIHRLRGEIRFPSAEALMAQIRQDIEQARTRFGFSREAGLTDES